MPRPPQRGTAPRAPDRDRSAPTAATAPGPGQVRALALETAFCCASTLASASTTGPSPPPQPATAVSYCCLEITSFCTSGVVAIDVVLSLLCIGLGLVDARDGGLHLLLWPAQPWSAEPFDIRSPTSHIGADVILVIGTLVRRLRVLGLRVRKVRLRLIQRHLVVGGVDLGQRWPACTVWLSST